MVMKIEFLDREYIDLVSLIIAKALENVVTGNSGLEKEHENLKIFITKEVEKIAVHEYSKGFLDGMPPTPNTEKDRELKAAVKFYKEYEGIKDA